MTMTIITGLRMPRKRKGGRRRIEAGVGGARGCWRSAALEAGGALGRWPRLRLEGMARKGQVICYTLLVICYSEIGPQGNTLRSSLT